MVTTRGVGATTFVIANATTAIQILIITNTAIVSVIMTNTAHITTIVIMTIVITTIAPIVIILVASSAKMVILECCVQVANRFNTVRIEIRTVLNRFV